MIITKTPLRISFAGGLTDIPKFYNTNDYGAVISTTINKYIYVFVNDKFDSNIRVAYKKYEDVNKVNNITHPIVRECLKEFKVYDSVEIGTIADIPGGTGLGSSSAFTVGLINALAKYTHQKLNKQEIAELACKIEINNLKENIGKQDQYACSFGGLNYITFTPNKVKVDKVYLPEYAINILNNNLKLFYLGGRQKASNILENQIRQFKDKNKLLINIRDISKHIQTLLEEEDIDSVGVAMNDAWELKKQMNGVTNLQIENMYNNSISNGALGGKVCGAGGSGFLLMYIPLVSCGAVVSKLNLKQIEFKLEEKGSEVIYDR